MDLLQGDKDVVINAEAEYFLEEKSEEFFIDLEVEDVSTEKNVKLMWP